MVIVAVAATGCAGVVNSTVETTETASPAPAVELIRTDQIEHTQLLDLSTEQASSLSELATGDRAVLLWFWSPSCVTCRAHALDIEAFAEEHADVLQVVGVGAWGSVQGAQDFIADTGLTTLPMLHETTGHLWRLADVFSNSSLVLASYDFETLSSTFRFDDNGRNTAISAAPQQPYAPQT